MDEIEIESGKLECGHDVVNTSGAQPKHEQHEIAVIAHPDTAGHPRTVVVHVEHTLATDTAVVSSWRFR